MRVTKTLFLVIVILMLAETGSGFQATASKNMQKNPLTDRAIPKGRTGIITSDLYIDLSADRNSLVVSSTKTRWHGKSSSFPEVVIFVGSKIWDKGELPSGFDLSKAIVVSFEKNKVRFFDFNQMSGGYYDRM